MGKTLARKTGAALWVRTSPGYRNDLVGYRRVD
jgi:hypothetical protein